MGYPNRGFVLDRLRGVFSTELLEEVQKIELPADVTDWPPALWAKTVTEKASEWERLGKQVDPSEDRSVAPPGNARRPKKR